MEAGASISKERNWFKRNSLVHYIAFKLFQPKLKIKEEEREPYAIHLVRRPNIFKKYSTHQFSEKINEALNRFENMSELEYILDYNSPCYIEPQYGWVIGPGRKAFKWSLPNSITQITPLPHYIYYRKKKRQKLEKGIPLFYNWFNYWHFYNDIIGSLQVLDKVEFDKSIPLIVPEGALSVQYVKDFFSTDYSKKWNWYFVDEQTYVRLDRAYIVKSFANIKDQFLLAADIFRTKDKAKGTRKIFINRGSLQGRNITNLDEILPIIKEHGFEMVDTNGMTVFEQKVLFESVSTILGIHGAGLTNMFYRYPESCTILELFPKDKYPIHYYWLAMELGFGYDAISGETNENESFFLDKNKLIELLNRN